MTATQRKAKIKGIQKILEVEQDGVIGPITRAAFEQLGDGSVESDWVTAKISSFADPADVEAFRKCKAEGYSDKYCFKFGDNGRGYYGDDTTTNEPMCALRKETIVARWGTLAKGKHKPVIVQLYDGREVTCKLADLLGSKGRVDLNPGACKALGLRPPALESGRWRWAT